MKHDLAKPIPLWNKQVLFTFLFFNQKKKIIA